MNDTFNMTLAQYIKLEKYHFNLVLFTITREYVALTDEQRNNLMYEIEYMRIVNETLAQVIIPKLVNRKRIVAWPYNPNKFDIDVLFEFSCIEVASALLDISETNITLVCQDRSTHGHAKGYCFAYKEDFNLTVKNSKF